MDLNDRARVRRENQKSDYFFMSDVSTINITFIFEKKLRRYKKFRQFEFDIN